jgi:uncharacterized protein
VPVIDFRARPNLPEYSEYLFPRLDAIQQQTRGSFGSYRAPVESLDAFVGRFAAAGIDRVVFAARNRQSQGGWALTNEVVADCVAQHPSRLIGYAGIDLDVADLSGQVHHAIDGLGLAGVCIDPFQVHADAAHERLDPVYATCAKLSVPVVVTLGAMPGVPAPLSSGNPLALDVAASRFPDTIIIGSHSGWPFVTQMIAVAWRRENVYFENSFYHDAPGADVLVEAANTMIGHKMLYASAYPFAPLEQTLEGFRSLPFDPDVRDAVLGGNATQLLASGVSPDHASGRD